MDKTKKLSTEFYNLDPTDRVNIEFKSDDSASTRVKKIEKSITNDIYFTHFRSLVMEEYYNYIGSEKMIKKPLVPEDVKNDVNRILEDNGLKQSLSNIALRLHDKGIRSLNNDNTYTCHDPSKQLRYAYDPEAEPLESIRSARLAWTQGIEEEVRAMTEESNRDFATVRPLGKINPYLLDKEDLIIAKEEDRIYRGDDVNSYNDGTSGTSAGNNINLDDNGLHIKANDEDGPRFLFDSEDLLETAASIVSPNRSLSSTDRYIGMLKVVITVATLDSLSSQYADLSPKMTQLGLDDHFSNWGDRLNVSRQDDGELIISNGTCMDARRFLRRGVTNSLRPGLWRLAFGLPPSSVPVEDKAFYRLRQACNQLDLLTDELYILDVKSTLDDYRYFVFEEELKEIMLCFSRDETIRHKSLYCVHTPLLNMGMGDVAKRAQIEAKKAYDLKYKTNSLLPMNTNPNINNHKRSPSPTTSTVVAASVPPDGPDENVLQSVLPISKEELPPGPPEPNSSDSNDANDDVDSLIDAEGTMLDSGMEGRGDAGENSGAGYLRNVDYSDVAGPPSAVQPFLGLCSYFAPLCFILRSSRPLQAGRAKEGGQGALYTMTRVTYQRIWCRMNVLSSDPGTLLYVCKLFEELLLSQHPRLFLHLVNMGVQPLYVAFPWMQLGFTTLLDIDELLLLWDRVFGYQDTSLLAVLAAGIFIFKADALFLCGSAAEIQQHLNDSNCIKVLPILQMMLFRERL